MIPPIQKSELKSSLEEVNSMYDKAKKQLENTPIK